MAGSRTQYTSARVSLSSVRLRETEGGWVWFGADLSKQSREGGFGLQLGRRGGSYFSLKQTSSPWSASALWSEVFWFFLMSLITLHLLSISQSVPDLWLRETHFRPNKVTKTLQVQSKAVYNMSFCVNFLEHITALYSMHNNLKCLMLFDWLCY